MRDTAGGGSCVWMVSTYPRETARPGYHLQIPELVNRPITQGNEDEETVIVDALQTFQELHQDIRSISIS